MKTAQNCSDLLLSSDPSRVGVGGVRGDADNIGPVAGQLGLDVGELLHHLATLPVTAVEDNDQISERISFLTFGGHFYPFYPPSFVLRYFETFLHPILNSFNFQHWSRTL